jgi:two-component system CheB/CheR fusion protein
LNSRWRIFQRTAIPSPMERPSAMSSNVSDKDRLNERAQEELSLLKAYHNTLLETLDPGIVILDREDNVINENESSRRMWQAETMMVGGKIGESSLMRKCPDLRHHLDSARSGQQPRTVNFDCRTASDLELAITIKPIESQGPEKALLGTLIYMEDVTPREHLQETVEELQTTAEELQSTSEERETTNEELQSTNEELETTNEELQSTNEELETTNEELKSLNEELEDINEELAKRSRQLDEFTERYSEMVEQMPWPLVLARADGTINIYNSAAHELFGFAVPSAAGMNITQLPMTSANHVDLTEYIKQAAATKKNFIVEDFRLSTNSGIGNVRVHIRPMPVGEKEKGALVMFEPVNGGNSRGNGRRNGPAKKNGAARKSKVLKSRSKTKRK